MWLAWTLAAALAADPLVIELYEREGCSRCEAAAEWLAEVDAARDDVEVVTFDVADPVVRARLEALAEAHGTPLTGVPAIHVADRLVVGFDPSSARRVEDLIALTSDPTATCDAEAAISCEDEVELPLFGSVDPARVGLPVFTVLLGLVDGFNPCATWVLLFLLSVLVNLKDRRRMALIAGTFVAVSGLAYYAFMAAWLNLFLLVGLSRVVQVVLAVVALAMGAVHIKDFFAFKKGITLSIPESARPGIAARTKDILRAPNLFAALGGAFVLAVLVNVVELLCTAGLPAIYTQVLVAQGIGLLAHYAYLAVYCAAYMADDTLMVGVAVVTLAKTRLQERGGRWLKLLSGVFVAGLGLLLLVAPDSLTW